MRGRYRVVSRLGRGGAGTVFLVEDRRMRGALVALKALFVGLPPQPGRRSETGELPAGATQAPPTLQGERRLIEVLREEFRVLAALAHPRLARVYDFGQLPPSSPLPGSEGRGGYFLTREFIDGSDLRTASTGAQLGEILRFAADVASALEVLHRAGMLHGDLKPANVIVTPERRVHLIDFGLARAEGDGGAPAGTLAYLAPEALQGRPVDRRADLYALGITLYELVTGALPYAGDSWIAWHLDAPPPRPRQQRPDVPAELDDLVARLCARDPSARPSSAREVELALRRLGAALGAAPPPRVAAAELPLPTSRGAMAKPLRALEEGLARRRAGSGGYAVIEVVGSAGSGKSTLLREFAWRAQIGGVEVLLSEARRDDTRPFGPLLEALDQVASILGKPHPLVGNDEERSRFAAFEAVVAYLAEGAAQTPLCIVLEDIDAADQPTRALLRFIAHATPAEAPLCVVVTSRTGSLGAAGAPDSERLEIQPLRESDVLEIMAGAGGPADALLAGRIARHTGGNPRFVGAMLRALDAGGWSAPADLHELAVPRSIEAAIEAEVAALSPGERRALEALAVLGRPASPDEIAAIADAEAQASLDSLGERGFVERRPGDLRAPARGAMAAHVYARIPEAPRRELHAAAARALQATDRGTGPDAELAQHLLRAGDLALAHDRALAAVAGLERVHAHGRAIELLARLLELLPEPRRNDAEGRSLRLRLARLERQAGSLDQAAARLRPLSTEAAGDEQASVLAELGAVELERGALDAATRALESVRGASVGPEARTAAGRELAALAVRRGDHRAAIALLDEALGIAASITDGDRQHAETAQLLGARAYSSAHLADLAAARRDFDDALAAARAIRRPGAGRRAELVVCNFAAISAFRRGDYVEAARLYSEALAAARDLHDVERVATMRMNLSTIAFHRGEYATILEHLPESHRLFRAAGLGARAATARSNLGQLYLELGAYEQARAELVAVREELEAQGAPQTVARVDMLLAILHARQGRLLEGRALYSAAIETVDRLGLQREAAEYTLDQADCELDAGHEARAAETLDDAARRLAKLDAEDARAHLLVLRTRLAARTGDARGLEVATEEIAKALDIARAQKSRELEWRAHGAAAELAQRRRDDVATGRHFAAAAAILDQMAAALDAEFRASFLQEPRKASILRQANASISEGPTEVGPGHEPRISRTEERFYRLLEINRQLNSEQDPARLLERIMDAAVELTGAERGFLVIWHDAEPHIEIARNVDRETIDSEAGRYSRSIAEKVFGSGEPLVTVSAQSDPRFDEYLSVHALRLESVLCIPVRVRGKVVGVLYMESRYHRGRFGPEDQRLLLAFGDQLALSLHNAKLLAENRARADSLAVANAELAKKQAEIEGLYEERGRLLDRRTRELHVARKDLEAISGRLGAFGLVGNSPAMQKVFAIMERVAQTDVPVLIEGESGTGKEMVARGIHKASRRKDKPLVSVNCVAIPDALLESELFGHVRGAFTGADRDRQGLFQAAHGGTLFLDEVGDTPARMQVDLLRALQERIVRPVGSNKDVAVDTRIITATNKPLRDLVAEGRFREDLFYRLNVVCVRLPPLRERPEDVTLLVDHLLGVLAARMKTPKKTVTREAMRKLCEHPWPGNVRQLEHTLMNAWVLADGEIIEASDLSIDARSLTAETTPATRRDSEKRKILDALEKSGWNKTRACSLLGMPRRTFYRRLRDYDIQ